MAASTPRKRTAATPRKRAAAKPPAAKKPEPGQTDAQRAEAQDEATVTFTYDGDTYIASRDVDIDVLEAAEDGKIATALRLLLGDVQWQKFRRRHSKASDLDELYVAFGMAARTGNS